MNRLAIVALLASSIALHADESPRPIAPAAGAVTYAPHPHVRWEREADVKIDEVHCVQIARDEAFVDIACDDRLEVVSRFVPVKPLSPAKYWWRVRRGDGEWSAAVPFEVRAPENMFRICSGSDMAAVIREAASNTPSRVDFEPGEYRWDGKAAVALEQARDLIIDGHGAKLVLAGTFLSLTDCQRVTIQHFTVVPTRPGHTLVRVTAKDAAKGSLTVKAESGHDPDVARFFEREGNGGSFLGCMDPLHHGRYIPGAGISVRNVNIVPADEPGAFVFSPVKAATLDLCPVGAVAVVTAYHWQWAQLNRTDECTFHDITVTGLPGAFCGGSDNSAKSYLSCKVKCRSPQDYFGGHSAVENGRIGPWIEDCEFECLPDDGPALQSLRMKVARMDGADAVVLQDSWTNRELCPGDHVSLVNTAANRVATSTVRVASPGRKSVRVQLDQPLSGDWKDAFFYRDESNNEDFVYRHNRHVGGRGHGVKFNGTRAWIADSHFENFNGNAVVAGFTWQGGLSGHGARDVVISGNTIVRCGWTPIEAFSTWRLGGNIVIRNNRIAEVRDAAIQIRGCTGVRIASNEFVSSTAPTKGDWIIIKDSEDVRCENNRHPAISTEAKQPATPSRPRLAVLTDIGGDPDDQQSMIRLMVYANEFQIEALIASASGTPGELKQAIARPDLIREIIGGYEQVLPNLKKQATGWPSADHFRQCVKSGNPQRGRTHIGDGHDTDGSRWLVERIDAGTTESPLNIAIWGGQTDLAQALWRVKHDRGDAGWREFAKKFRVYDISDQDGIADWMRTEFPRMFYILAKAPADQDRRMGIYRGMYLTGDESLTSCDWIEQNIRRTGPLGALYPTKTWTAPNPHGCLKEGDTPSWFFFLPPGGNDLANPEKPGWGGQFQRQTDGWYRDLPCDDPRQNVSRWRPEFQRDFARRMAWCQPVSP